VVAGALNTSQLSESEATAAVETYCEELGVPASDPVRFGAEEILEAIV